jgi:hypothetical protein
MRMGYVPLVFLVVAVPSTCCIYLRATEQSARRIEREHGIRLPKSATAFQCAGTAWHGILDREAISTFEIDAMDLPVLTKQLRERAVPGPQVEIDYHRFRGPWDQRGAAPLLSMHCDSTTGDWLDFEAWRTDGDRIVIWLYTNWD